MSRVIVARCLAEWGYSAHRVTQMPPLSAESVRERLAFTQAHRTQICEQLSRVLWSDESSFQLRAG